VQAGAGEVRGGDEARGPAADDDRGLHASQTRQSGLL
jgi:hypothetical protein